MASVTNGRSLCVVRNAVRNSAMWSISAVDLRSCKVTVKKNVPPGMKLRRIMDHAKSIKISL